MPAYLVIANASAGSAEQSGVRSAVGVLSEHGPSELVWTSTEHDVDVAIDRAGDRTVVIAGGDGSIHLAVNRLRAAGRLDRPSAILPAGTGNDLARNLGLPLDLEAAAEVIAAGTPRPYSVLETDGGEIITNNIHVGLGVEAARRAVSLKSRLGKLAYPLGTMAEAVGYDGLDLTVTVDGQPRFHGTALAAVCMLGPSVGGGVEFIDQGDRQEPIAEVVVVSAETTLRRAGLLGALARRELAEHDGVSVLRGTTIEWSSATGSLEVDMDGEIEELPSPLTMSVLPAAWSIVR